MPFVGYWPFGFPQMIVKLGINGERLLKAKVRAGLEYQMTERKLFEVSFSQ
jgi:hypothetical protein